MPTIFEFRKRLRESRLQQLREKAQREEELGKLRELQSIEEDRIEKAKAKGKKIQKSTFISSGLTKIAVAMARAQRRQRRPRSQRKIRKHKNKARRRTRSPQRNQTRNDDFFYGGFKGF